MTAKWVDIAGRPDPRGYTGLEGVSVGDQRIPAGATVQLLNWAGAPNCPVRSQVLVGNSPPATVAERAALRSTAVFLRARWSVGAAQYEAETDLGACFAITCSQLALELVNGSALPVRVNASITPGAPAPSARRTQQTEIGAGVKHSYTVPTYARDVAVLIGFNAAGGVLVGFNDGAGANLAQAIITPQASGPYVFLPLPAGAAVVEVTNPTAGALKCALVFDLGT